MTSKYTNKNGVKFLAAVLVLAVALSGAFVIFDNENVDAEVAETLEVKAPLTLNGKYIFANGTPIVIEESKNGTAIKNTSGEILVDGDLSSYRILGGGDGSSSKSTISSSNIVMNGGSVDLVAGGGYMNSSVETVSITINGGTIDQVSVGGFANASKDAGKTLDAMKEWNYVKTGTLSITDGDIAVVTCGGAQSYAYVNSTKTTITGGTIAEIIAGGMNGYTGESKLTIDGAVVKNGGYSIEEESGYGLITAANRGEVNNVTIEIKSLGEGSKAIITPGSLTVATSTDGGTNSIVDSVSLLISQSVKADNVKILMGISTDINTNPWDSKATGKGTLYRADITINTPGKTILAQDLNGNALSTPDYEFSGNLNIISGKIKFVDGSSVTGTISNGKNSIVVKNMAVGTNGLTIENGSIALSGDFTVNTDGSIVITGVAKVDGNLTITGGTSITISEGAQLLVEEGKTLTVSNSGSIQINGEMKNSGTMTIAGDVKGTIDNENGTINISAATNNLTVSGGNVTTTDVDFIPILEGGVELDINGDDRNYMTYSFTTADDVTVVIGIPEVTYTGQEYAGKTVVAKALRAFTGNESYTVTYQAYAGYNNIYEDKTNAIANNHVFGSCIDVGDSYWVSVGLSVTLSDNATSIGTFPVVFAAPFYIIPQTLTGITIDGPVYGEGIANKAWNNDNEIELINGVEYKLYKDGLVSNLVYGQDYTVRYEDNTEVGTATIIVVWTGNYTTAADVEKTFQIVQGMKELEVTVAEDKKFYVGEIIGVDGSFEVVGIYDNGDRTDDPARTPIVLSEVDIISIAYDGKAPIDYVENMAINAGSTAVVKFSYESADRTVYGTCNITIVGIDEVEVENVSDSDKYKTDYDAGDSLNANGMKVTVTYTDGKFAVFINATEVPPAVDSGFVLDITAEENKITTGLSTKFTYSPEVFNTYVGDNVKVEVIYFGTPGEITVTVTGYGIIYLDADGNEIAWQCGLVGKKAAIYNYVWNNSSMFIAWEVEDFGTFYLPGDMIGYGENAKMWGDDNTLKLKATFYEEPAEEKEIEQIGAGFVFDADDAAEIMAGVGSQYTGTVADRTMFIVYEQSGFVGSEMVGYLVFENNIIYSEELNDANGIRTWLFSDADNTVPGLQIVDGLYTFVIDADDQTVMSISIYVKGTQSEPVGPTEDPTETGIFVDTTGVQIAFAVGDEFSSEGLVVKVIMSDGTIVDAAEFDVTRPAMDAADNKAEVIVTYGDFTASYYVAIISSEPAPVEPTPANSVDMYIKKVDGAVKAVIIADEGYVVDGIVTVTFSYTAYDDFAEEYVTLYISDEAEVVSDLESSVLYATVSIPADVSGIYAASAVFAAEGINANSGLIFC